MVLHETRDFWVKDVGQRGYEVYRTYPTHSVRVASIGHGATLGLPRAIEECTRRQTELDQQLTTPSTP